MSAVAAPVRGRRASLGAAAVLAGFLLLAPPLYLLGPFALLALLARPRTTRELFWLAAAAAGVSMTFAGPVPLGYLLIRVSGVALSVCFVLASLRSQGPIFPRALATVVLAAGAVALWAALRGIGWPEVEAAFTEMLRASYRSLGELGSSDPKARQDAQEFVRPFLKAAPDIARLLPGLLALEALGGLLLAWAWHHRLAVTPLGSPPAAPELGGPLPNELQSGVHRAP